MSVLTSILLQRARICLVNAQEEATHHITANNAYIDLMVDEAVKLLTQLSDSDKADREALMEIEKLLRPENYNGSDEQAAKAWELANYRLAQLKG